MSVVAAGGGGGWTRFVHPAIAAATLTTIKRIPEWHHSLIVHMLLRAAMSARARCVVQSDGHPPARTAARTNRQTGPSDPSAQGGEVSVRRRRRSVGPACQMRNATDQATRAIR